MWMAFSVPFWLSALLEGQHGTLALLLVAADCLIGLPVLMAVYKRINNKYKASRRGCQPGGCMDAPVPFPLESLGRMCYNGSNYPHSTACQQKGALPDG